MAGPEEIGVSFYVDLASLERSLEKALSVIDNAFSGARLSQFDAKVRSINDKVASLKQSLSQMGEAGNEAMMAFSKAANGNDKVLSDLIAKLDTVNEKKAVLAAGFMQDSGGRWRNRNTGQFVPAPDVKGLGAAYTKEFRDIRAAYETMVQRMGEAGASFMAQQKADAAAVKDAFAIPYNTDSIDLWAQKIERDLNAVQAASKETRATLLQLNRMSPSQIKQFTGYGPDEKYLDVATGKFTTLNEQAKELGITMTGLGTETKSWMSSVAETSLKWGTISTAMLSAYKTWEFFKNSIIEGVQTVGEFQQQMVQLHSVMSIEGITTGKSAPDSSIMTAAMQLATRYGDNINDVSQNIMLWFKSTEDLNSAIALSNESLKFQLATGTDLEDTYRTLTALSTQLGGTTVASWDKTKFSIDDAHKALNMIYAAAAVSGAGMRDVTAAGKQMGVGLDNAAGILLHSLDQDADSLKNLGLNVSQIIALNQALITSMGNTGSEADSVSERMARLVAGLGSLSEPSKASALQKAIGSSFNDLKKILSGTDADGEKMVKLINWWQSLDTVQKNSFANLTASQRGYQTLNNLAQSLVNYEKNLKAEKDNTNSVDQVAEQMNDTFLQQVKQLQGLWQGIVTIIGVNLIGALSDVIKVTGTWLSEVALGANIMNNARTHEAKLDESIFNAYGHPRVRSYINTSNSLVTFPLLSMLNGASYNMVGTTPFGKMSVEDTPTDAFRLLQAETVMKIATLASEGKISETQSTRLQNFVAGAPDATSIIMGLNQTGPNALTTFGDLILPANIQAHAQTAKLAYTMKHIQDAADLLVKSQGKNPPDNGSHGMGVGTPTGSGVQTPAQMTGQDITDLTNEYHAYTRGIQDAVTADEAYISIQKKKMDLFGPTSQGLQNTLNLYKQEANTLQGSIPTLQKYAKQFQDQINNAQAHLSSGKLAKNSDDYKRWSENLDRARTSLSEVNSEINGNSIKAMEAYANAVDAVNTAAKTYYDQMMKIQDSQVSEASKNFQAGTGSLNDVVTAYQNMASVASAAIGNMVKGTVTWQNAMQEMHDKGTTAIDDLKQKWDTYVQDIESSITSFQSRGIESTFSALEKTASPTQKNQYEYYKQLIKSQQELNQLQIQYHKDMKEAGADEYLKSLANDLLNMGQATIALDVATAQYTMMVEQIQSSGIFHAFDTALAEMGSTLGTSTVDQIFGNNSLKEQIGDYDQIISKINQEKQLLDLTYSMTQNHSAMDEANHKLALYMMDQQIQKEQQLKKAEEDRLNNPGIFKKFAETFTKTIIDDMVKQLEQNVESSILSKLMPNKDQALITAMQQHATAMQNNFAVPAKDFNDMLTKVFQPDIEKYFSDSAEKFHEDVEGPLYNSFKEFTATINQPFAKGMASFHADVQKFVDFLQHWDPMHPSSASTTLNFNGNPSGSGTSTYYFSPDFTGGGNVIPAPTDLFNTDFSGYENTAINDYLNFTANQDQTNQALGNNPGSDVGSAALALAGLSGISGVGGIGSIIGGMSGVNGSPGGLGGGFLNLLLSAGGGGSSLGLAGSALGLIAAYSGSQNKGNFALGSLGGVLAAGGVMAMLTGGTVLGTIAQAAMFGGPIGWGILLGSALLGGSLGGMIGPHYSPSTNPDMFGNSGFAQEIANAQGYAYTQANGNVSEDPTMSQALGGMTELQYLDAFVSAHPGGQGLSGASLQLWQQVNAFTRGGTAIGVHGLHQGNVGLSASMDNNAPTWNNENWQQLTQQIDSMTQSVEQFNQALQQGSTELIAGFNQFGSGVGFFPYIWAIPGYDYPANPDTSNQPGAPGSPHPPTNIPTPPPRYGGGGPGGGPGMNMNAAYNYSPYNGSVSSSEFFVETSLNVDGRNLARSVQAHQLQTARRGFSRIS